MTTDNTLAARVHRAPCVNGDVCGEPTHCPPADTPPAEDAHPAPAAAPVVVPEDEDVMSVGCGRCGAEPGAACTGSGEGYHLARFDRLSEQIARETPRPEPVVAPPPSEAVERVRADMMTRASLAINGRVDAHRTPDLMRVVDALVAAGYRLVPEDDEDTVRVPRGAVDRLRKVAADDPDSGRMTSFRALTYGRAVADFLDALGGTR